MNVSLGERWESFVDTILKTGRYGSASEVVREGLRLVEEREAKLQALRETVAESLRQGGEHPDDAVGEDIRTALNDRHPPASAQ
jgi:antitoxin ParD1/3/4